MKRILKYRLEMVWFVLVVALGVSAPSQLDATLCSTLPIFYYDNDDNYCHVPSYDCYGCVVWP